MSTREDYRQFACECLRLADNAKDGAARQILLKMADAWTVIALVEAPLLLSTQADWPRVKSITG